MPSSRKPAEAMVPCPGCGGRGRFEWARNEKVPRQWSPNAACGMCGGKGQVPASWLKRTKVAR
jgi:DnaJ-class molecular chaperone